MILKPVMGQFETYFQKEAFQVFQKALLDNGIPLLIKEPDWSNPSEWSEREKIIPEALTKIGLLYYEQVPDK